MTQFNKDIEKVRDFLRQTINPLKMDEVQQKKDLMSGRYFICAIGEDSHKISVMYTAPDDALLCVGAFQRARLTFQRPTDKPYLVQILIKTVLAAIALRESAKPLIKEPKPIVPETVTTPEAEEDANTTSQSEAKATSSADLEVLLKKLRTDKDFGYTNTCTKKTAEGRFRGYYFKTVEQAEFAKEYISQATDKAYVSARGLYVPSLPERALKKPVEKKTSAKAAKIKSPSAPKIVKPEKPEPKEEIVPVAVTKTADDIFAEYKSALRLEIEQEYQVEVEELKEKLLAFDHRFDELLFDNYIIPKKGEADTITFEIGHAISGSIKMGDGVFTIRKELLSPFCQAVEKRPL
jgi:hypothetical protein